MKITEKRVLYCSRDMEDVKKWVESRLGSVPGLLAIIVTDRCNPWDSCAFVRKSHQIEMPATNNSQGGSSCCESFYCRLP